MLLAVDPGRDKTGWALADRQGTLICSGIIPARDIEKILGGLFASSPSINPDLVMEGAAADLERPELLLCGDGTTARAMAVHLEGYGVPVIFVDERGTTLEARELYWQTHPPRGWRRLFPLSIQTPPRDLDDLAALCILRRYLACGSKRPAPGRGQNHGNT